MKNLLISALLTATFAVASAQQAEQVRTSRIDLRMSAAYMTTPKYAEYPSIFHSDEAGWHRSHIERSFWMYRVEANYQIHRHFRVGLWGSYGFMDWPYRTPLSVRGTFDTHVFGGGLRVETQLLPLLFERFREEQTRINVFASAEFGGFYFRNKSWPRLSIQDDGTVVRLPPDHATYGGGDTFRATATVGLGASVDVSKRLSVFAEGQLGGFLTRKTEENSRLLAFPRFGLIVRL